MEVLGLEGRVSVLSLEGQNSHSTGSVHFSSSQTLASDLLIIIVNILLTYPNESYAPLICSHVCRHWREAIVNAPSLWTHVDTARGVALTHLWLTNAKDLRLNVRLWDCVPCEGFYKRMLCYLAPPEAGGLDVDPAVEEIMQNVSRWRSANIAFSCISSTSRIVKRLGNLSETLLLDRLIIGPMGQTTLAIDDGSIVSNPLPSMQAPAADPTFARLLFQSMNVMPAALYVDTYPVAFSPIIFSSHLTVLEVFCGNYHTDLPDTTTWHQILSHTPQLVRLRLWSPYHPAVEAIDLSASVPLHLPGLEYLELTGTFIILSPLFTKSPLPMLRYLRLDCLDEPADIPRQLAEFGPISPALTGLYVGSMCFSATLARSMRWTKAFRSMRSLEVLTLADIEWREVMVALEELEEISHGLSRVELKEIWDVDMDALDELLENRDGLPAIEIIDCLDAHHGRCTDSDHYPCSSESGSNYSDNSSFVWEKGSPPSVLDSEGSEISYGEDEGPEMGEYQGK
ncbi:hypothetical protein FRC08_013381 [Ceratobasidium sp. 394]|nr:hypothetical protein FRC08_013381 [Ceratobasidium sp. 394]KAG9085928.1 hypothetical protein FS749_004008 [Ceratobasidium sp. UAMH 11750]